MSLKRLLLIVVGILACPFLLVLLFVVAVVVHLGSGYLVTQLDSHLVPTAEALIAHPAPTAQYVESISPPPGSTICGADRQEPVTIGIFTERYEPPEGHIFARMYVNNQRLGLNSEYDNGLPYGPPGTTWVSRVHFYRTGLLEPGLHLFEVEFPPFPLYFGPGESYRWAYEITEECEPASP